MPVFYTQSNQPRNFGYMAQNNKPIMELQGKMRRIDTTKAVAGTWEGLVNQPTTCQARSNSASSQFNFNASSKRTVCPEQNVYNTFLFVLLAVCECRYILTHDLSTLYGTRRLRI